MSRISKEKRFRQQKTKPLFTKSFGLLRGRSQPLESVGEKTDTRSEDTSTLKMFRKRPRSGKEINEILFGGSESKNIKIDSDENSQKKTRTLPSYDIPKSGA